MNSRHYDDLSFKLLSATIFAGVIAAFMAPSAPSATVSSAAQSMIASQPTLAAQPSTPVTASAPVTSAAAPNTAPTVVPEAAPISLRHHSRRHGIEKT